MNFKLIVREQEKLSYTPETGFKWFYNKLKNAKDKGELDFLKKQFEKSLIEAYEKRLQEEVLNEN